MSSSCVDADVILKGTCYRLMDSIGSWLSADTQLYYLGTARYSVAGRLRKIPLNGDRALALQVLQTWFDEAIELEPSTEEASLAAKLELAAQKVGGALDVGESQLIAIALARSFDILATGDKRAALALQAILTEVVELALMAEKVVCLEQCLLALFAREGAPFIRSAVCAEPSIDKAATISLSCVNPDSTEADWEAGLRSYIRALKQKAPDILSSYGS